MESLDEFGAKVYTVLAKLRREGYFVLEEKDLQAIAAIVQGVLAEDRQETDRKIDAIEKSTDEKIREIKESTDEKIREIQKSTDEKIRDIRREMNVLVESKIEPQLKLLAEGQQDIRKMLIPRERFDDAETDISLLKGTVRELIRRVTALEKAK